MMFQAGLLMIVRAHLASNRIRSHNFRKIAQFVKNVKLK